MGEVRTRTVSATSPWYGSDGDGKHGVCKLRGGLQALVRVSKKNGDRTRREMNLKRLADR